MGFKFSTYLRLSPLSFSSTHFNINLKKNWKVQYLIFYIKQNINKKFPCIYILQCKDTQSHLNILALKTSIIYAYQQ